MGAPPPSCLHSDSTENSAKTNHEKHFCNLLGKKIKNHQSLQLRKIVILKEFKELGQRTYYHRHLLLCFFCSSFMLPAGSLKIGKKNPWNRVVGFFSGSEK